MKHLALLLITSYLLLSVCACRTSRHERTENIQSTLTDTAHFARIFTTASDSTATLTWIAIDTLDVWLSCPDASPDSLPQAVGSAQTIGRGTKVRARNLRLVRAETRSARTSQDSLLARHQTSEAVTSEVKELKQPKPASTFPTVPTIINLIALAILALILYFYLRQLKTKS